MLSRNLLLRTVQRNGNTRRSELRYEQRTLQGKQRAAPFRVSRLPTQATKTDRAANPRRKAEKSGGEQGMKEVFLTAKQVAERYGMSKQWPYHCPELQAIRRKIGRSVRWKLSDIEEFERQDREKATGGKPADLLWEKAKQDEKRASKVKFTM
jgi:predicted DNA-binding transcriptional regulator AlpA